MDDLLIICDKEFVARMDLRGTNVLIIIHE